MANHRRLILSLPRSWVWDSPKVFQSLLLAVRAVPTCVVFIYNKQSNATFTKGSEHAYPSYGLMELGHCCRPVSHNQDTVLTKLSTNRICQSVIFSVFVKDA